MPSANASESFSSISMDKWWLLVPGLAQRQSRQPRRRSPAPEAYSRLQSSEKSTPEVRLPLGTLWTSTHAGRSARLEIMRRIHPHQWNHVDILVSCPRTRPISRSTVEYLRPNSVVALMAEPWELSPEMVDLNACSEMRVKVAAPNLEHPAINLLPDLARLCCRLLQDAGIDARDRRIAVLCDTPLRRYIEDALIKQGARVTVLAHPQMLLPEMWDAVVVALRPAEKPSMDINGLARVSEAAHGSLLIQFSGEIDRLAARDFGLRVWPPRKPGR